MREGPFVLSYNYSMYVRRKGLEKEAPGGSGKEMKDQEEYRLRMVKTCPSDLTKRSRVGERMVIFPLVLEVRKEKVFRGRNGWIFFPCCPSQVPGQSNKSCIGKCNSNYFNLEII